LPANQPIYIQAVIALKFSYALFECAVKDVGVEGISAIPLVD